MKNHNFDLKLSHVWIVPDLTGATTHHFDYQEIINYNLPPESYHTIVED